MSEIYLGNPNLKKANTQIQFSAKQIEEFMKCKNDPLYFTQIYVDLYMFIISCMTSKRKIITRTI